jgi:hypothetical protein
MQFIYDKVKNVVLILLKPLPRSLENRSLDASHQHDV